MGFYIPEVVCAVVQSLTDPVGHELVQIINASHGPGSILVASRAVTAVFATSARPANF